MHPGLWQVPVWVLEDPAGGIWSSELLGGRVGQRGGQGSLHSPTALALLCAIADPFSLSRPPSVAPASVDYGNDGGSTPKASTYSILSNAFEQAYNGNRGEF